MIAFRSGNEHFQAELITKKACSMKNGMFWVPLVALLAGCGGSGGGSGNGAGSPNTGGDYEVAYSELRSEFKRIGRDSARVAQNQGYTSNLPTSGTATYAGTASFSEHANPQILANANLVASLKDSSISGRLTDFRGDDGTVFDGTMNISNGSINASESSITAAINGHLTSNSARMSTVDATGEFSGHFIGDNHRYVRGQTSAMWITNAGTGTEEHIGMHGELRTEKQY